MSKQLTPAVLELADAINEARTLTAQASLSKRDESRVNVLLAQIKALREGAVEAKTKPEVTELELRWLKALHRGGDFEALRVLNPGASEEQLRNMAAGIAKGAVETREAEAGSQTITYTQQLLGGTLVPNEFAEDVILGEAQYDPLLDSDYVRMVRTQGARPFTMPGWDLSTFAASRISEGARQTGYNIPTVAGKKLGGYTYRASLAASYELEEDAFEPLLLLMKEAFSIGFARGVGVDLVNGTGTNQPQGVVTGATATSFTLNFGDSAGVTTTLNDAFQQTYFAVNRIYRAKRTCCWLMNDSVYQWCRTLTDKQGRPLINIQKDREEIMGKPVLICPSLPGAFHGASPAVGGKILFGDLSKFIVRQSQMTVARITEAPGYVENGLYLYTTHVRVDSVVHDPTNGTNPPLVSIGVN
jgi:HK97 family phage major capsid protein